MPPPFPSFPCLPLKDTQSISVFDRRPAVAGIELLVDVLKCVSRLSVKWTTLLRFPCSGVGPPEVPGTKRMDLPSFAKRLFEVYEVFIGELPSGRRSCRYLGVTTSCVNRAASSGKKPERRIIYLNRYAISERTFPLSTDNKLDKLCQKVQKLLCR